MRLKTFAFLAGILAYCTTSAFAQLVVTQKTAAEMAQAIVGSGVTVSNVTFQGVAAQGGTFTGGVSAGIGIESGIILSTGDIADAVGPNAAEDTSTDHSGLGDTQLDAIVNPAVTYDAAVLEFDFISERDSVAFRYVFGSEEYEEFVGSEYNDVFAFFFGGNNIARVPGTTVPVTINNVNHMSHTTYYRDNVPATYNVEFDGFTAVLTASASVTPGASYHIKLAVGDTSDWIYDSAVFIEAGSFEAVSKFPGDFNADGKTDLLWRNYSSGEVNVWFLNGTTYMGGANLFTVADSNWRIEGTGDFNGDDRTDLIWRNYSTGAVNVWFLNGTTYLGGMNLFTVTDLNWEIEAVGDLNDDGHHDLIWRNYSTGAVNVWFMNGTTYLGGANLFTVADANWKIQVAADFNGDGNTDLIWRNYSTGAVNVWFLNGTTYVGGANLFTVADANWRLEAVGDYNGDGMADLIWRNYATGAVNVWFLNGTTYIGGANLFNVASSSWEIAGPR